MYNIVLGDILVFCPWHKDKQSIYILPESFQVLCVSLLSESRSFRFGFHLHVPQWVGQTHLEDLITRHKLHIQKLELILRLLDNDELSPEQVNDVKDFVEDYVERNQVALFFFVLLNLILKRCELSIRPCATLCC